MFGPFRLSELIDSLGAELSGQNVAFSGVSTDSRTVQPGDLFVALVGDKFNGHEFIEQARSGGAVAAIISEPLNVDFPCLKVEDTTKALGQLGAYNRAKFHNPVVAITGSSGKTTVKGMVASVLSQQGNVLATRANYNNHIGAPLTLLELSPSHDFGVIELGASGAHEIAYTANFTKPDVSILTNASEAHMEGFGSLEVVVETKGEIIDALSTNGIAILNKDDPYFDTWFARAGSRKVISFGVDEPADVRAHNIQINDKGFPVFDLCSTVGEIQVELAVLGNHNVVNALSAAAAAIALGLSLQEIKLGLQSFKAVGGRLNVIEGIGGMSLIDDTYNANPASVRAALDTLAQYPGEKILVLGEMAEMGEESRRMHAEVGAYGKTLGIDALYAMGNFTRESVDAFGEGGHWFASRESLVKTLQKNASANQQVLIKGSRSARMEAVVEALKKSEETSL